MTLGQSALILAVGIGLGAAACSQGSGGPSKGDVIGGGNGDAAIGTGDNAGTSGDNSDATGDEVPAGDPGIDSDNDGVPDHLDDFPLDQNEWLDTDGDGTGNNADEDDDDDGLLDAEELTFGSDCALSDPLLQDGDEDGILDPQDPYPLDPYAEFVINQNDLGNFYFFLSNRDGTFQDRLEWGWDISDNYVAFAIADFDNDGLMDFIGHSATPDAGTGERDVYFFSRIKLDEFYQIHIGTTAVTPIGGIVADINNDNLFDLVATVTTKQADNYIATVTGHAYLNNGTITTAGCAVADAPDQSCAFTRVEAFHLGVGSVVQGQWGFAIGRQAVDITNDGNKDIVFATYASGGATSAPLYRLEGLGDGTFTLAPAAVLTHQHPVNSVVFADFDSDDVGDVIMGLDDDGDPGQAWLYLGTGSGTFGATAYEAFDIQTGIESGSDEPGRTTSARTFDFDFDGDMDVMVGHNHVTVSGGPSKIELFLGNGDGSFTAPLQVGPDIPDTRGNNFAIPQRLCPWYSN